MVITKHSPLINITGRVKLLTQLSLKLSVFKCYLVYYILFDSTQLDSTRINSTRLDQWRSQHLAYPGIGPGNALPCQGNYINNFKNQNSSLLYFN